MFLSEPATLLPVWGRCETGATNCLVVPKTRLGRLKALKHSSLVSEASTRSGRTYEVLLGTRLPVSMIEVTDPDTSVKRWYACSPGAGDCGDHPRVPARDITWEMDPPGVEKEGEGQRARTELEPGDPNTPDDDQWWLRGIRTTTGKIIDGADLLDTIELVGTAYGARSSATVEVKRPSHLKACDDSGTHCKALYRGKPVDLEPLLIDAADLFGMPPHYLAAQMVSEADRARNNPEYINAHVYRYEPTSRDFKYLTGDQPSTVSGVVRRLLLASSPDHLLGLASSEGKIEYLPCENSDLTPCSVGLLGPPEPRQVVLTKLSETSYQIPALDGQPILLGVQVFSAAPASGSWRQTYPLDCALSTLGTTEYCVNGDTGLIRFGASLAVTPVVAYRLRLVDDQTSAGAVAGFGELVGDVSGDFKDVCTTNSLTNNVPCDSVSGEALSFRTTIREWARNRPRFLSYTNAVTRYGERFELSKGAPGPHPLEILVKTDPAFDVQAQFLAAASYGVMQIIPESFESLLRDRIKDPTIRDWLKKEYYDPMKDSPMDRLFNPVSSVPMGALFDRSVDVPEEKQDEACVEGWPTQCSWGQLWWRRFCRYNGDNPGCQYGKKILDRSVDYAPMR